MLEPTEASVIEFLGIRVREHWKTTRAPYLLSTIAHDLAAEGVPHRKIIGRNRSLKSFLKSNQEKGGYDLIQHPGNKTIGIIPSEIQFVPLALSSWQTLSLNTAEKSSSNETSNIGIRREDQPRRAGVVLRRLTEEEKEKRSRAMADAEDSEEQAWSNAAQPLPSVRPKSLSGVPSVFGYGWSESRTIVVRPSSADVPRFPFPSSERDHAHRLGACRVLAEDLIADLRRQCWNVRDDYRLELKKYVDRLPDAANGGSILLADAAARSLRDLFAAEVDILPPPLGARLKTVLEQHMGLRPYYPEIEIFYRDVQAGHLNAPLPLDAVEGVVRAVQKHTPDIFDPSVVSAIDEGSRPARTFVHEESKATPVAQPAPPRDPLGELDISKAHDFQVAGIVNNLWRVFAAGEKIHNAGGAWRATYDALAPPVGQVLNWLRSFLGP